VSVSVNVESGALSIEDMVKALREVAKEAHSDGQSSAHSQGAKSQSEASKIAAVRTHSLTEPHSIRNYATAFATALVLGFGALVYGNKTYAPEMYSDTGMIPAADAQAKGLNYAVFDLNLNVRAWRDAQLARMTKTPDVIIIGASQWQEAHKDLLKGMDFFNAHIHRDYWEDLPGMVELLVRHDRLPKKLIIAVRDKQFTPVDDRKDWLWEPGIPAYRAFTKRVGMETESWFKTAPWHRWQALISLPMFFENFTRWQHAPAHPGPTTLARSETMDMILPDGSILWSNRKLNQVFTRERTLNEVDSFAKVALNNSVNIAPEGVAAWRKTFEFLKSKGVQVYLVNPPFNPDFYDQIEGTPYAAGLAKIEALTQKFSKDFGFPIFGNFNPHKVGCVAEQYIDAEHANPVCMQKIFDQFVAVDKQLGAK